MNFFPDFGITILNGFLFILPLLFIRIGLPKWLHRDSQKLDHFAPTEGIENTALHGYFITNTILIFTPLFFRLDLSNTNLLIASTAIYIIGIIFLTLSVLTLSRDNTLITQGVYKISRNPMYVGYFLIFIGVGLFIHSILYLLLVMIYQLCVHILVISEERWCNSVFKEAYQRYLQQTSRYIGIKKRN